MKRLAIQVTRFLRDDQPGWIECEFEDAEHVRHILIDKVPIFSHELLDEASVYPREGVVRCQVLGQFRDALGRDLLRIALLDGVTSTEDVSEFVVLANQISDDAE